MLTVSNYHYIREEFHSKYPSIFGVTPKQFKKQLSLFKNQGDFVTIKDLNADIDSILVSKNNYFLITFDDGLKEQYKYGYPIMETLDIEGYFFVNSMNNKDKKVSLVHKIHLLRSIINPSEFIKKVLQISKLKYTLKDKIRAAEIYVYDEKISAELKYILNFLIPFKIKEMIINKLFEKYFDEKNTVEELYMNTKEIIYLANKNFIGSHSHSHYPLGLLENKEIEFELQESKKYLEKITEKIIDVISYPYGTKEACTEEVVSLSDKEGYSLGFTTERGVNKINQNLLLLKRFDCNDLIGGKSYDN